MKHTASRCASSLALALSLLCTCCQDAATERLSRAAGATVVAAIGQAPDSLDPRVGTSADSYRLHQLLYNTLVTQDADGRIVPELAVDWLKEDCQSGSGEVCWVMRLREGVRFHDGRSLSAADVVYTFNSLLDEQFVSRKRAAFDAVDAVFERSPGAVVFRLNRPNPAFLQGLPAVGIVPEGFQTGSDPLGTGPFRYAGRQGSQRFELEANEHYFAGPPQISRLLIRVIPDETTRALELMHGSVDLVINDLPVAAAQHLAARPELKLITAPGLEYQYLGVNHSHPILSDRRVRRAISLAIDRQTIIDSYLGGLARPAPSPLMPQLWSGPVKLETPTTDLQRARELLDSAGYPDPDGDGPRQRFELLFKCSNSQGSRDLAVILAQHMSRISIGLQIRSLEFQTFYADIVHGNFAMYPLRWVGIIAPDFFGACFHSTSLPDALSEGLPPGTVKRGSFNRGQYSNPEVDRLIELAEQEEDDIERWRLYARLHDVLAEDLPYINLWYRDNFAVMRSDLEGLELTVNASFAALRNLRYTPAER